MKKPLKQQNLEQNSKLDRRQALGLLGAAGTVQIASHVGLSAAFADPLTLAELFDIRLPDRIDEQPLKIYGKIPPSLHGTYYKVGPALRAGFPNAYRHLFDGDGFVQLFRFGSGTVSHAGRFVATSKYQSETKLQRYSLPTFATVFENATPIKTPDDINAANTNIIVHGDRTMALWEGASAWQLDPQTLSSMGPVDWKKSLTHAPFSAHPRPDRDGSLWNFGHVPWAGKLILYHIGHDGLLKRSAILNAPETGMVHDFAVTDRSLILVIPPFRYDPHSADHTSSFLDMHRWHEAQPVEILVIDKSSLEIRRRHQIDPGFHFHLGAAREFSDGTIELDMCQYRDASVLQNLFLDQLTAGPGAQPLQKQVLLRPTSTTGTVQTIHERPSEFPHSTLAHTGQTDRPYGWSIGLDPKTGLFRFAQGIDMATGKVDQFDYGAGTYLEEHIFVSDPQNAGNSGDTGWLIGLHHSISAGTTQLSVFNAFQLSDGPIATARLNQAMPPGLHGSFTTTQA